MDEMFWKFSHIGENIFKKLSNEGLVKCKMITRSSELFINKERFYKQRVKYEMIQKKQTKTEKRLFTKPLQLDISQNAK